MKKILVLTLGATLMWAGVAFAADAPEGKKGPRDFPGIDQRMEVMTKQLALTTEQQTKVKALFEQEIKTMREARGSAGASQIPVEERRKKMMERREAMDTKLKEILTPEQWTKWEKQRRGPQGGPGFEKRGEGKGEGKRPEGAPPAKKQKKKAE